MTKKYFAVYAESGKIISTGDYIDGLVDDPLGHLGELVIVSDSPIDAELQYVSAGALHAFPEQPSPAHTWDWSSLSWSENLSVAKTTASAAISAICKSTILAGFESSALGAGHHYPAKTTDQQNLASSVLASLLPGLPADWTTPFWCADSAGEWEFRPHTTAQIQQVGQDAKAAILWAMGKNELLQAAIAAATTIEELEAITW